VPDTWVRIHYPEHKRWNVSALADEWQEGCVKMDESSNLPERYWHCRVSLRSAKRPGIVNDLSLRRLLNEIVLPWQQGRIFTIAGYVVSSRESVESIQIVQTALESSALPEKAGEEKSTGRLAAEFAQRALPFVSGRDFTEILLPSRAMTAGVSALKPLVRPAEKEDGSVTQSKSQIQKKPRVFIGSSVEGLKIAKAIQANLDHTCTCSIWTQGAFGLGGVTLEQLVSAGKKSEFAVIVVTPDDMTTRRGQVGNQGGVLKIA